jgi:DNA-binding XRE family transcriptional regulator
MPARNFVSARCARYAGTRLPPYPVEPVHTHTQARARAHESRENRLYQLASTEPFEPTTETLREPLSGLSRQTGDILATYRCMYRTIFESFLCYTPGIGRLLLVEVDVDRLRELRRLRALSQEELSAASGVGRATISRIERAETGAQGRTLRKLAAVLGVDVAELVAKRDKGES